MEFKKIVDTSDFMYWGMNKYNMTNSEWHKKIWDGKNGLCNYILDSGPYVSFSKIDNPKTLLEKHVNDFLEEYPELNNEVNFVFTN